jgi:hypothetical protein
MILTMSSGRRLRLEVLPAGMDRTEVETRLHADADTSTASGGTPANDAAPDWARWDDEAPHT